MTSGTTLLLQIVKTSQRASRLVLASTPGANLVVFDLKRISATCLYSYWSRTSAFAESITDKLNKSWLMLDFWVMRLMSPDHLDFPRMNRDEPRMAADRSNFGSI